MKLIFVSLKLQNVPMVTILLIVINYYIFDLLLLKLNTNW